MNILKSIKKRWIRYLLKMEKVNKKQFGNKRLECCDLNKSKN